MKTDKTMRSEINKKFKSILRQMCFLVILFAGITTLGIPIIVGGLFPIADTGVDQDVNEGSTVTLNGLSSWAYDLTLITYQWTQISGTPVILYGANSATPQFTAPEVGIYGETLGFQLIVSDGEIFSFPAETYISVHNVNRRPVANAGGGQSVAQNVLVSLDASASFDLDGDALTYTWSQTAGPMVALNLANPIHPSFNSGLGASLSFSLVVSDGYSLSDPASVNILVNSPDHPPIANAGLNFTANERTIVYLNGAASSDPDGGALSYLWTQLSGPIVTLTNSTTATPSFSAPEVASNGALLTFKLIVSAGLLQSAPALVSVQILNVNRAPIASSGINQSAEERMPVNLDASASFDPDGDPLTYLWTQISGPPVLLSMSDGPKPYFFAPEVSLAGASIGFAVTVSDGVLSKTAAPVYINVINVNRAPIADAGPDQSVDMQTPVILNATASMDPDADAITYQWSQIGGPIVVLNLTNPLHPTFIAPKAPVGGTSVSFTLIVNDGKLASDLDYVNISIKNVNQAPIVSAGLAQIVSSEGAVYLDASDSFDPDADAITFLWNQVSGPAVSIINGTSVSPNFTAPIVTGSDVVLTFKVSVSDGKLSASANVTVTVQHVNHQPIANAGMPQTILGKEIATLNGGLSADPDGDALTYTWSQVSGPVAVMDPLNPMRPRIVAPDISVVTQITYSLVVSDGKLSSLPSSVVITVKPIGIPPSCNLARIENSVLWPPNHKMAEVFIEGVYETDHEEDLGNKITYTGVTQDEPTNGLGDGDTAIDAVIKAGSVLVRSERQGTGTGRVYTVKFNATNIRGESCSGSVKLCVPKAANNKTCIEEAKIYDSTQ